MSKVRCLLICIMLFLVACARQPIVDIEVTDAIFIDEESLDYAKIYLNIRNQTKLHGIEQGVRSITRDLLEEKGYDVVKKASEAELSLRAVILNIQQHKEKMSAGRAFSTMLVTTGSGAIIGGAVTSSAAGVGAGAGIGAGIGILGVVLTRASQPEYWYGLVEIEIAEPHHAKTNTIKRQNKKKVVETRKDYVQGDAREEVASELAMKEADDKNQQHIMDTNREQNRSITCNIVTDNQREKKKEEDIVVIEEDVVERSESGKKRSKTKMMVRIEGSIDSEEALRTIQKALAHRLANFF